MKPTQTFNDGVCSIYKTQNTAEKGCKPVPGLVLRHEGLRYEERVVGVTRFYTAMRENERIDRVLRVPGWRDIAAQDIAVVNGDQYRIQQVQPKRQDGIPVTDISVQRLALGEVIAKLVKE